MSDSETPDQVNMLQYFWREKGDYKCCSSYDVWAKANAGDAQDLERLLSDWKWAEKRIDIFLEALKEKYPQAHD